MVGLIIELFNLIIPSVQSNCRSGIQPGRRDSELSQAPIIKEHKAYLSFMISEINRVLRMSEIFGSSKFRSMGTQRHKSFSSETS